MEVHSTPGQGTCFTLRLPLVDNSVDMPAPQVIGQNDRE
jgi:hypothetical protein